MVGHLADKHGPRRAVLFALVAAIASFIVMGFGGNTIFGLVVGVIFLDLGIQAAHVANQTRIYALDANARSRLNMVYMICYFMGGAAGSFFGSQAWQLAGWWGVCGFGVAALIPALGLILRRA